MCRRSRRSRTTSSGTCERRSRACSGSAPARAITVDVRTGDTPAKERERQRKDPGQILITTPESLYLILAGRSRERLRNVDTIIVDEIHAFAPTKRGIHLALTLERLSYLVTSSGNAEPQRIGLSATQRPLIEVAKYLGGDRPVEIVDASAKPSIDLEIVVPTPDMDNPAPAAKPNPNAFERETGARDRRRRHVAADLSADLLARSWRTDRRSCSSTRAGSPSASRSS